MCISTPKVKKKKRKSNCEETVKPKIEVHSAKHWLGVLKNVSVVKEKKGLENCFILKGLSRHEN